MNTSRRTFLAVAMSGAVSAGFQRTGWARAANDATPEAYAPEIDPALFTTTIDNRYYPLVPGTVYTYEGETEDGPELNVVTVTNETREVMGVTCVVVHDVVEIDGEVAEDTLDWFAQDDEGNVWYFGEESRDIEDGVVVSTKGSWEAGVDGAQPGIIMLAEPTVGAEYRQEYYPGEAEDMGKVLEIDAMVEVPFGAFTDVLMTEDWNPLEENAIEHKSFAPGIGLIMAEALDGSDTIRLVSVVTSVATPAA